VASFLLVLVTLCPTAFLAVAGDGPLRTSVAEKITSLGLQENVALLGYVQPVHDLIQAADVVVLLSRAEGISQVLVQAAAVGTPFVAYDVDGAKELIKLGATGCVVSIGHAHTAAGAAFDFARHRTRGVPIDVSTWSQPTIVAGYRQVTSSALHDRPLPC
jgi:glycosyltransferase involved in cell wall biosynthesis